MQQENLVLILARDLADKLASAVFVCDREGTLVYYNDKAAEILGRPFAEVGRMRMDQWSASWSPQDLQGRPLQPDEIPLVVALREVEPTHNPVRVKGADGEVRDIEVTALPLLVRKDELVGAVAMFWELSSESRRS